MEKEVLTYSGDYSELLKGNKIFDKISYVSKHTKIPAYVVGGFVRDAILGVKSKDIDVTIVGNAKAFATYLRDYIIYEGDKTASITVYETYGTVQLKTAEYEEVEFVTARNESYSRDSRNPECHPGTLYEDLIRRDLTFNAMAISLCGDETNGMLIDLFGGLDDLKNRIARTPIDPSQTFSDDPLRMLRTIRFATKYHCIIEKHTYDGIRENRERIKIIVKERIHDELNKILSYSNSYEGMRLLYKCEMADIIFDMYAIPNHYVCALLKIIDEFNYSDYGINDSDVEAIKQDLKWISVIAPSMRSMTVITKSDFIKKCEHVGCYVSKDSPRQYAIHKLCLDFMVIAMWATDKKRSYTKVREFLINSGKYNYDSVYNSKLWVIAFLYAVMKESARYEVYETGDIEKERVTTGDLRYEIIRKIDEESHASEPIMVGRYIKNILNLKEGKIYGFITELVENEIKLGKIVNTKESIENYIRKMKVDE